MKRKVLFSFLAAIMSVLGLLLLLTSGDSNHFSRELSSHPIAYLLLIIFTWLMLWSFAKQINEIKNDNSMANNIPIPLSYIKRQLMSGGIMYFHCNICDGKLIRTMFFVGGKVDKKTEFIKVQLTDNQQQMLPEKFATYHNLFKKLRGKDPCFCIKCGIEHEHTDKIAHNPLNMFDIIKAVESGTAYEPPEIDPEKERCWQDLKKEVQAEWTIYRESLKNSLQEKIFRIFLWITSPIVGILGVIGVYMLYLKVFRAPRFLDENGLINSFYWPDMALGLFPILFFLSISLTIHERKLKSKFILENPKFNKVAEEI